MDLREVLLIIVFVEGIVLATWAKIGLAKKSDVYNSNGTTKFMPASACQKTHDEIEVLLREVRRQIELLGEKREKGMEDISKSINNMGSKVAFLSGQFDQWQKSKENQK